MSKFTTPCFVRVEDAEKRKELIEWLEYIGWSKACDIDFVGCDKALVCLPDKTHYDSWGGNAKEDFPEGLLIDCGDNIDLFKALAAMNDENDREQWFVCTCSHFEVNRGVEEGVLWLNHHFDKVDIYQGWSKATAEEIIEYFKTN